MPLRLVRYPKMSPFWYIRGTVHGKSVYESAGTDNKAAAEDLRIRRESELLHRSIHGAGATVTFAEAVDSYLKAGGEAKYLGAYDEVTEKWSLLVGEFALKAVASIGQVEADEAADKISPGTSPATRKRQVYGPLKAVLNHAAEKWQLSLKPIKNPRVKKVNPVWATPNQVRKLLQHCTPKLRLFVAISVYTGERLEQVVGLNWDEDIDLQRRIIIFRYTKNGEMRTVHIPEALLIELALAPEQERRGPLFHWSHKTHIHKPLKTACAAAGIPYFSPHKIGRHTYATWMRMYAGRDLRGLMEDGNWKSINSVVRYTHTVPGETAKAVELLPTVGDPLSATIRPLKDRRIRKKIA